MRLLSWFWEAPDWILDMSWFVDSDSCTSAYRHETGRYFFLEVLGLAMKLQIFAER